MVCHPANIDSVNLLHDGLGHGTLRESRPRREEDGGPAENGNGFSEKRVSREQRAGVPSRKTRN